tara:strand:- start:91 stop:321 length:231 start_codon:yes stop_codon:yes gene_type:complete
MFEVYGTSNCVYCDLAKKLLTVYDKEYAFIDVAEDEDITAAFFNKFPNVNQVPQIMEDDKYIGGYNELMTWLNHTE